VEAFIASQRGEGWTALPDRYDDGGYTGANTDRPAFQRLIQDIEAGKVDVVGVYKIAGCPAVKVQEGILGGDLRVTPLSH